MKFEIDDLEMIDSLSKRLKEQAETVIKRYVSGYDVEQMIIKSAKQRIDAAIAEIVRDELSNSGKIREMVRAEMVKSIKSKLKKLEKEAANESA